MKHVSSTMRLLVPHAKISTNVSLLLSAHASAPAGLNRLCVGHRCVVHVCCSGMNCMPVPGYPKSILLHSFFGINATIAHVTLDVHCSAAWDWMTLSAGP